MAPGTDFAQGAVLAAAAAALAIAADIQGDALPPAAQAISAAGYAAADVHRRGSAIDARLALAPSTLLVCAAAPAALTAVVVVRVGILANAGAALAGVGAAEGAGMAIFAGSALGGVAGEAK